MQGQVGKNGGHGAGFKVAREGRNKAKLVSTALSHADEGWKGVGVGGGVGGGGGGRSVGTGRDQQPPRTLERAHGPLRVVRRHGGANRYCLNQQNTRMGAQQPHSGRSSPTGSALATRVKLPFTTTSNGNTRSVAHAHTHVHVAPA
jgi:hypothetical protein